MNNYTDEKLIELIKSGNEDAFYQLTLRYLSLIRSKASMYKVEAVDFDDLVQEGFLALLQGAKNYKSNVGTSFKTYVSTCISNRFITILKLSNRKKDIPKDLIVSLDNSEMSESNLSYDPVQTFIDDEDYKNYIEHVKAVLSPLEYKVLNCYLAGNSYEEIADILNLPSKAVDNALQRTRKKLKNN